MSADTMTRLWVAKVEIEERALRLGEAGHAEAADQVRQSAYRLGNALLEVDAVVQQYAAELAELEPATSRKETV